MCNDNSMVIRSVEHLKLPDKYERLARELLEQIDMPVVFWMDAELPKNFRCRHPGQKNQFWVTIRPNCDENEKIRLIIGGIYGAMQEQRRYWRTGIQPEYEAELKTLDTHEHLHVYYDFVSRLGNLATALEVEWYLLTHGIRTARSIRQTYFRDRKNKLKEYIVRHNPRLTQPYLTWYQEIEVINLIEYGDYYRLGEEYRRELRRLLNQIDKRYIPEVEWVANQITTVQQAYTGTNGAELTEQLLTDMIEHFQTGHMVRLCKHEAYIGRYPIGNEDEADVLSYVLNTLPRQKNLINWLRMAREFICVYREAEDNHVPDITMNVIETDLCNAYADGDHSSGYCISFTNGLIYAVTDAVENWEVSEGVSALIGQIGESEVRRNLLRQVIFHITAHEYAHVINGDCDDAKRRRAQGIPFASGERETREANAKRTTSRLIHQALPLFYRFPPAPAGEHERMGKALRVGSLDTISRVVSSEREEEIKRELQQLLSKWRRDWTLAEEAERIVNQLQFVL